LSEKDQRRFAALEARQRGYGGVKYTAGELNCSRGTIERGLTELDELANDPAAGRLRRPEAGRKKRSRPAPKSSKIGKRNSKREPPATRTTRRLCSPIFLREPFPKLLPR